MSLVAGDEGGLPHNQNHRRPFSARLHFYLPGQFRELHLSTWPLIRLNGRVLRPRWHNAIFFQIFSRD